MGLQFSIAPIAVEVELATYDVIICYLDVFRRRVMGGAGTDFIGSQFSNALHMDGCIACSVDGVLRKVAKERHGADARHQFHVKSPRYDDLTTFQKRMLSLFSRAGFYFWENRVSIPLFMEVYSDRRVNPNASPVYIPGRLDLTDEKNLQAYRTHCRNDHFHRRTQTAGYRPKLKDIDLVNMDIKMLSQNAIYMGLEDPLQVLLPSWRLLSTVTLDCLAPSVLAIIAPLARGVSLTGQTRLALGGDSWGISVSKRLDIPDCVIALFDEKTAKETVRL